MADGAGGAVLCAFCNSRTTTTSRRMQRAAAVGMPRAIEQGGLVMCATGEETGVVEAGPGGVVGHEVPGR